MIGKQKPKYTEIAKEVYRGSAHAQLREAKLKKIEALVEGGCRRGVAIEAEGLTQRTYYRYKRAYKQRGRVGLEKGTCRAHRLRKPTWLGNATYRRVVELRKEHPTEGRELIHAKMLRPGEMPYSVSTVGNMLRYARVRGEITTVRQASRRGADKRKRRFGGGTSQRWCYGTKRQAGHMIQVDHMSVRDNGKVAKHFCAVCPETRVIVSKMYRRASSRSAGDFLRKVYREMPMRITSVQVDGGSELRGEFEEVAEELGLKIYVLPARRPQLNGMVERLNRTMRGAFYSVYAGEYDPPEINEGRCHTAIGVPPYFYAQSLKLVA